MNIRNSIWANPVEYLAARKPDFPVQFFNPVALQAKAEQFLNGFPGLVTFAVKSNPDPVVITNLLRSGIKGFDVASPNEIRLIRKLAPDAAMHYNNPVKSRTEITFAVKSGVRSFSLDSRAEFEKLRELAPKDTELSVRFKLPVKGAIYNFGSKFGATPEKAADLLREVEAAGFTASLTFHPGTQCEDRKAWQKYIRAAGKIATAAGVKIKRLNVGGGFPSTIDGKVPNLAKFFALIDETVTVEFGDARPDLVCEPGRGLVADAFAHAPRIKGMNDRGGIYLNDGIYGGLSEFPVLAVVRNYKFISPKGALRTGKTSKRTVFGPTCDSLDVLPNPLDIPSDAVEGDYILFQSMGAYVKGVNTDFNGYGQIETVTVLDLN